MTFFARRLGGRLSRLVALARIHTPILPDRSHFQCTPYPPNQDLHSSRDGRGPLLVPTLVITEVTYLLASRIGTTAEVRFLGDLAEGNLVAEPVVPRDWLRIAELAAVYRDLPLGTADASVVAAAERLGIAQVATLDRRHFSVVRPLHVDAFELVP
ncbi:type II toxin-antitoxin system VapC family toxin [Kribbella sp. VKM Ac-2568]|uniref:type II toxin-antitoxin system VapC family toxin n=1 Tax=Kribbella sp. VKM Ac-2568 TaxID=2512219 RepID=UPI001053B0F7|nr:PIN domain-containing protein [Kribbella sp. VKM Ac-2568]TCM37460.1 hypothetical protein EV648_1199 [Kribbella sp. VKM Ac-2568]